MLDLRVRIQAGHSEEIARMGKSPDILIDLGKGKGKPGSLTPFAMTTRLENLMQVVTYSSCCGRFSG
jgi:hypothetical protein